MIHPIIHLINIQNIPTLNPTIVPIKGLHVAKPVITPDTGPAITLTTKPLFSFKVAN